MIIKTLKELDEKSPRWSAQLDPESALVYLRDVSPLAAHFVHRANLIMPTCSFGQGHSQNGAVAHTVTVGSDNGRRIVIVAMKKDYNTQVYYGDLAETLELIANVSGARNFEAIVHNNYTFKVTVKW